MSDFPDPGAGSASSPTASWTRVGDALVDRDDIIKAINALSELPDSDTVIIKSLKDINSPLAGTDYRGLADQYLRDHPKDNRSSPWCSMAATSLPATGRPATCSRWISPNRSLQARLVIRSRLVIESARSWRAVAAVLNGIAVVGTVA
jgi:hypothetical protein